MNAKIAAGTLLVLVLAMARCSGSGGNGPVDPPDPPPVTQVIITAPEDGLIVKQGTPIPCDDPDVVPPDSDLFPQWWLKGENDWMKIRGDSIQLGCGSSALWDGQALKYGVNTPATPPLGDYVLSVHVRRRPASNPGAIKGSAHRTVHVTP